MGADGRENVIGAQYNGLLDDALISAKEMLRIYNAAKEEPAGLSDINRRIETALHQDQGVKIEDIGRCLEQHYGMPYFHFLPNIHVKPVALIEDVRKNVFQHNTWLPVSETLQNSITCVVADPDHRTSVGHVSPQMLYQGKKILWMVTTYKEFDEYREWLLGAEAEPVSDIPSEDDSRSIGDLISVLDTEVVDEIHEQTISETEDNEIVKVVNKILIDAYRQGASDIHIEPMFLGSPANSHILVRIRKDGTLREYARIPFRYWNNMISRIKIMAGLDIAEKRRPQDGKFKIKSGGLSFELRLATHPSQGGVEDAVLRILAASKPLPLEKMGFTDNNLAMLKGAISKPYGLFFVCGPTGSGKTTTLHSVLGYLNNSDTKILTAEDPVEITQQGLRQVQINKKAGLDFAAVMKSFLRCDPDIIMVGEMRDKETVSTGIEASLTGHLVFSTLHTNSAPESIIRLIDMGIDPFNFADALLGILAQRLAKTLCSSCKVAHVATQEDIRQLILEYSDELKNTPKWRENPSGAVNELYRDWLKRFGNEKSEIVLYQAKPGGCDICDKSGYKGRVGLHELMIGTDEVKEAIQKGLRPAEISLIAMDSGMRTLKQDGIEKVLMGKTDLPMVRAVCIK